MRTRDFTPVPQEAGKTQFDYHYRAHVIPRLNQLASSLAKQICRHQISYDRACCVLCLKAVRLGGTKVSDWDDLEEYLISLLADFTDQAMTREDI